MRRGTVSALVNMVNHSLSSDLQDAQPPVQLAIWTRSAVYPPSSEATAEFLQLQFFIICHSLSPCPHPLRNVGHPQRGACGFSSTRLSPCLFQSCLQCSGPRTNRDSNPKDQGSQLRGQPLLLRDLESCHGSVVIVAINSLHFRKIEKHMKTLLGPT